MYDDLKYMDTNTTNREDNDIINISFNNIKAGNNVDHIIVDITNVKDFIKHSYLFNILSIETISILSDYFRTNEDYEKVAILDKLICNIAGNYYNISLN